MAAKKASKRAAVRAKAARLPVREHVVERGVDARAALEAKVGRLTLGKTLRAIREGEELTLNAFGKRLGLSAAKLCDIEQGRRGASIERAAEWARRLGYSEAQFVRLALQEQLEEAGLSFDVKLVRHSA